MEEKCLECKHCRTKEDGIKGALGEILLECKNCEEETEDKNLCFEKKDL